MTHGLREQSTASTITLASMYERAYREFARHPAVIGAGAPVTYGGLGERVHRLLHGLGEIGIRPGDRVIILMGNRPEFFEIDHALFVGGFIRVALSFRLHPREVAHIVNDCQAAAVVADEDWARQLVAVRAELPSVAKIVVAGAAVDGAVPLATVAAAGHPEPPERLPGPDDPASLLYTSGTTGSPKGATLSQGNWAAMVRNSMVELPPIDSSDVMLHVAPLSHLSGYAAPPYFVRGASHLPLPTFDPRQVLDVIAERGVTAMALVPTMLNLLLLEAEGNPADTSSLRTVLYGASPIAPDRLARAIKRFGEVFVQFYGLSETPMPLTCLSQRDHRFDPAEPAPARLASAGRVNPFVELKLVDDDGNEVAQGEIGEIVVRGDTVMLGYWGQPEQTREMIDADGWAATGDLGRQDEEGYVAVVDRKKDMIVSGGYNIYPNEVENAIATVPAVQEVAVVGIPDERWGETIKAVVVVRPGYELTESDVIAACTDQLAGYKKPRSVDFVDELPKTGSGKIMRRHVRERYWAGQDRQVG